MNKKRLYALLFCFLFSQLVRAQSLNTNTYFIKSFGYVLIPEGLDTLSQKIVKKVIIENYFDIASESGIKQVKNLFNVNMGKNIIASMDSTVTVFWPMKSLFSLLNFNTENNIDTNFTILPSIMFKKNSATFHSSDLKKSLENQQKLEEFKKIIIDSYQKGIELVFTQVKIKKLNVQYFLFRNNYPCFKVSLVYGLSDDNYKVQYSQDLYSLFREKSNYLFKFEFEQSESLKWINYESEFLKALKFL